MQGCSATATLCPGTMNCQWCCHPIFETITSNNDGVLSLMSGNFQESIRCFHRALEHSRRLFVLLEQQEGEKESLSANPSPLDLSQCRHCRDRLLTPNPCQKLLTRHTHTIEDITGVQVFNEPMFIDESSWITERLDQDLARNLVVATVILNTAMAYHFVSFSHDDAEMVLPLGKNSAPLECRRRAKGLYEKVLQVLMTLDVHHNEITGTQCAVYDLVLMAALNNLLSMKDDVVSCDPNSSIRYTQHLMMYAMNCGSKNYGESGVASSVSKWQGEFLANAMVSKFCKFSSASAA